MVSELCENTTDAFKYDTYGRIIERTGTGDIIFGYNGRDGVITDSNGLLYMRARCYFPEISRFVNADIIHGEILNAITLNRYAYANGNSISNVDSFGLSAERIKTTANSYNTTDFTNNYGNINTAIYIKFILKGSNYYGQRYFRKAI